MWSNFWIGYADFDRAIDSDATLRDDKCTLAVIDLQNAGREDLGNKSESGDGRTIDIDVVSRSDRA